jgi:hypothetical protein
MQYEEEMKLFNEKSNDFGIEYVIIDDENIDSYGKNARQVRTDFDEGFTLEEYRVACAILQAEDVELDVYMLSESEFKAVEEEFIRRDDLYEWLYSKKDNKGYTCPRATLLSLEAAKKIASDPISRLYNGGIDSVDDLYSTRSKNIWLELKSKYSNKKKHPLIIDGFSSLEEITGVKASLFENSPKGFPCIFIGTKEKPEYLYAPDNVENDEDFLYGYLLNEENNKKGLEMWICQ